MSKRADDTWVMQVMATLELLMTQPNTPKGDVAWLLARCTDTLKYPDDLRQASTRQLVKDLKAVQKEFPGLFPEEFLLGPTGD